ncbi:protein nynrin-like [Limosa lapponica baueri]|uniref:Protein nynrin-like n=1 Tax=Limosa lapponica baueri TaxID=1758121 RepID=A0A2I0T5N4_LIMLA|nr:protein nynrin-like [Limosa lapponica baueri]
MDLQSWKETAGVYREYLEKVAKVFETIIRTQDPDWNDLQVILETLLDSTEEGMVLNVAWKQAEGAHANGDLQGTVDQNFPTVIWDGTLGALNQIWLLFGIRHAMPKAINWSKLYEKAELIVLQQALKIAEGERVNIWTDSKYAFGVVHAHGVIWKERGLLSAQGSPIKHKEEILQLLQDVQNPKEVVINCKAHQFGQAAVNVGTRLADKSVKELAEQRILALVPTKQIELPVSEPNYSKADRYLALYLKATENERGWLVTPNKQVIVPPQVMIKTVKEKHKETHWGSEAMFDSLSNQVISVRTTKIIKSVTERAAINYLLLRHNHGCEEFKRICCFNLTDNSKIIEGKIKQIHDLATGIKERQGLVTSSFTISCTPPLSEISQ